MDHGGHEGQWHHQGPDVSFSHSRLPRETDNHARVSIHNDWRSAGQYASGEAKVDLYGWDGYPMGFDCSHPDV